MKLETLIARFIEDLIVQREDVIDPFSQSIYTKAIEVLDALAFEVFLNEDNSDDILKRHIVFWLYGAMTADPNSRELRYYMVVSTALTGIWCKYNII